MSFRFLHAADLHLDTPFQGLRRTSPEVAELLRDASLEALEQLVQTALREEVAFVVLAGDVYDGAERGLRAQSRLRKGVERLSDAGIRTFLVRGNHDPVDEGWSAIRSWPRLWYEFATEVGTVRFDAPDGTPVAIHGISYATRRTGDNLALRFGTVEDDAFHVAVLHANVGGDPEHDRYSPCTVEDLSRTGHHYWALGHIHRRRVLSKSPVVAYPGNLQGRGFQGYEQGPKGALLVEVTDRVARPSFVPLDRARYLDVPFDVTDVADVAETLDALREQERTLRGQHEGRFLVLRAQLTGRGTLADDLRRDGVVRELLGELGQPGASHWAGVVNDVTPEWDIAALREREDLLGTLVRLHDELAPPRIRALAAHLLPALAPDVASLQDDTLQLALREALLDAAARLRSE